MNEWVYHQPPRRCWRELEPSRRSSRSGGAEERLNALVKPHQAGEVYASLATTVAWKTVWSALVRRPWCLRVRNADNVCAQFASRLSTCSATEKRRLMVKPSTLIDSTRSKPATAGGRHCQGTSAVRQHEHNLRRLGSVQLQIVDISPLLNIHDFRCTRLYIGWRYKFCVVSIFMHRVVVTGSRSDAVTT
jgi:hypothetical protein